MSTPTDLSDAAYLEVVAWAREGDEVARREIVRCLAPSVYDRAYQIVRRHEKAKELTTAKAAARPSVAEATRLSRRLGDRRFADCRINR